MSTELAIIIFVLAVLVEVVIGYELFHAGYTLGKHDERLSNEKLPTYADGYLAGRADSFSDVEPKKVVEDHGWAQPEYGPGWQDIGTPYGKLGSTLDVWEADDRP